MEALGLVTGSAFSSGINLYAVVALLGIFGRYGDGAVPDALTSPVVIGVAGAFYLVEFVADKIPFVDNVWDALHTVIRPAGAAALGVLLAGDASGTQQFATAAGSGTLGLIGHGAKASSRAAINTSPEPASNIVVSLLEDGLVAGLVWFAVNNPVLAAVLTVLMTILAIMLMVGTWRMARDGIRRLRERWRARGA